MSRMLKALKRLEARRGDEPETVRAADTKAAGSTGTSAAANMTVPLAELAAKADRALQEAEHAIADELSKGDPSDASAVDAEQVSAAIKTTAAPSLSEVEPVAKENVSQTYVLPPGGLKQNPFATPTRRKSMTEAWTKAPDEPSEEPSPENAAVEVPSSAAVEQRESAVEHVEAAVEKFEFAIEPVEAADPPPAAPPAPRDEPEVEQPQQRAAELPPLPAAPPAPLRETEPRIVTPKTQPPQPQPPQPQALKPQTPAPPNLAETMPGQGLSTAAQDKSAAVEASPAAPQRRESIARTSPISLQSSLEGIHADILNWVKANLPGNAASNRNETQAKQEVHSVDSSVEPAPFESHADEATAGDAAVEAPSTPSAENDRPSVECEPSSERFVLEEDDAESTSDTSSFAQRAEQIAELNVVRGAADRRRESDSFDTSRAEESAAAESARSGESPPDATESNASSVAAEANIEDGDEVEVESAGTASESEAAAESAAAADSAAEPDSPADSQASAKAARPASGGMLKNRFQEPARHSAAAASLEEQVQQSLDDDRLAPQYRRLASNVKTQYPGDVAAVLLLTAPAAHLRLGETLMHLAALLADEAEGGSAADDEARVLVVDACLSAKLLTERMQSAGKPGLAEVLGRRKDWHDYVAPTARARIDFLPAGEGMVTSYKSIGGKLAPLLEEWKQRYRYVLVDAGGADEPLTDPLAQACDATYLHVSLTDTAAAAARQAAQRLRTSGARLRGCLVDQ
jgi:Mrp family chromosome partitioning ATPase